MKVCTICGVWTSFSTVVASVPAKRTSARAPPGCRSANAVTSYTRPPDTIQQLRAVLCRAISVHEKAGSPETGAELAGPAARTAGRSADTRAPRRRVAARQRLDDWAPRRPIVRTPPVHDSRRVVRIPPVQYPSRRSPRAGPCSAPSHALAGHARRSMCGNSIRVQAVDRSMNGEL